MDEAARLKRFLRSFDARDLWPGVEPQPFRIAQESIAAAITAILAGHPRAELALAPGVDVRTIGVAASAAGVGPLLGAWCASGALRTTDAVAELLAAHLDHGRRRAARLGEWLDRVLVALTDRGIPVVVLKGMETGRRYFAEPALRTSADIDVLVRAGDFAAAAAALGTLGLIGPRDARPQRATWDLPGPEDFGSLELAHEDNPASVDLHVSLDRGPVPGVLGRIIVPDVAACVPLAGLARPALALPEPLELLFLALHTSYHFSTITLVRLYELALVARADFAAAGASERRGRWVALLEQMREHGAGRFAFPALALAEQLAPGSFDPAVLAAAEADAAPWLRAAVWSLTPGSAQRLFPVPRVQGLRWARTPVELARGVGDLVWPRRGDGERVDAGEAVRIYVGRMARAIGAARRSLS